MSSLNLRAVHVYEKIPGKAEFRLKETHPAVRLGKDDIHLFLQDGQVFDAAGHTIEKDKLPGWFTEEVAKMSPVALREAGFKLAEKKG